jgi:hypothetical protein
MEKKGCFPLVTKIVGIIITAWILFLVTYDVIKQLKKGIESFFNSFSDLFTRSFPYIDTNVLIWIFLVGYAIVWWKKLWGSIIMIIVSIYGIIISEAGDIRFHFMLTFLVGFLYFVLYFVNLYFERKRINDD